MLLKAGDVSYSAKTRLLHLQWIERAVIEQTQQSKLEQALGLPLSASFASPRGGFSLPKSQLAHSRYISTPIWSSLAQWARATKQDERNDLLLHMRILEDNVTMWEVAEMRLHSSPSSPSAEHSALFAELFLAAVDEQQEKDRLKLDLVLKKHIWGQGEDENRCY
jgi:hypothetical protein